MGSRMTLERLRPRWLCRMLARLTTDQASVVAAVVARAMLDEPGSPRGAAPLPVETPVVAKPAMEEALACDCPPRQF
jgi:hypothetical protein